MNYIPNRKRAIQEAKQAQLPTIAFLHSVRCGAHGPNTTVFFFFLFSSSFTFICNLLGYESFFSST